MTTGSRSFRQFFQALHALLPDRGSTRNFFMHRERLQPSPCGSTSISYEELRCPCAEQFAQESFERRPCRRKAPTKELRITALEVDIEHAVTPGVDDQD